MLPLVKKLSFSKPPIIFGGFLFESVKNFDVMPVFISK